MRRAGRLLSVAVAGLLLVAAGAGTSADAHPRHGHDFDAKGSPWSGKPFYAEQQLATNGEGGFPNYRIPALTVTNSGDLLAAYDGRPTGIDSPGPNSILQRRSRDNGRTWEPVTVIHGGKTTDPIEGYSDPSYIVDRQTGTIFNFHVKSFDQGFFGSQPGVDPDDRNVQQAEVSTSRDNGRTWTHRVITADVTPDLTWRSRFATSGQGIQLKYGRYAGRLLQQFVIINGEGTFQAVSVYSDDHGRTWQAGQAVGVGMDENKTVELSDGRVMLNSRDSQRSGYRKVTYSSDGGETWGPVSLDKELIDPANNAAILRAYPNAKKWSAKARALLFSNAASSSQRVNGTIRMSFDDGQTWPVSRVFQPGSMSYSTLATLPDGKVGLLYEPGDGIRFARFNLAWLEGIPVAITAPDLSVERGTTQRFRLTLENQGKSTLRADELDIDLPDGWSADYRQPGKLKPGRSVRVPVKLTVPASTAGGDYALAATLSSRGRSAHGTVRVNVPKTPDEIDGRISVEGGTLTNPQTDGYQVGDVLRFTYTVTNLSNAVTTVVPTGNLRNLDPAVDTVNCRYRNLAAHASYTCTFANHTVTQEDLDHGSFTPTTTWTSTSGTEVTSVEHEGPAVTLG